MMERFEEEQKFGQVRLMWLVAPLGLCFAGLAILLIYQQFILEESAGGGALSNEGLIVTIVVMLLVVVGVPLLIASIKLTVRVNPERLLIHFRPVSRAQIIPLADIASWEVLEYRALRDYGGYGLKYSFSKRHWCYTVSGNRGVLVRLNSGKALMIGSQRADELVGVLTELSGRKPR